MLRIAAFLFIFIIFCFSFAQSLSVIQDPLNPQAPNEGILGCLSAIHGEFQFTDADGNSYLLTGKTSGLEKHSGEEIRIKGTKEVGSNPFPKIYVTDFKEVFRAPKPKLSDSFIDSSNWRTQTDRKFGINFALPKLPPASGAGADSNFVAEQGTIKVAELGIDGDLYPNTNFVGGGFAIFVNPEIRNVESCRQFGTFDPRFASSRKIAGIDYQELTSGDAAAGTSYGEYYFHTFQHNLCFELSFRLGEYNTSVQDLGCTVPIVGEDDFEKVIDALANRVSFVTPSGGVAAATESNVTPNVTSFSASSLIADNVSNRGTITFRWSTQATDYIAFSFRCSVITKPPVVILQRGGAGNCENDPDRSTANTERFHRSPNSSTDVTFGNMHSDDPIIIAVKITPFSHGKAYPNSSKLVTVTVLPYNPFPDGVPSRTQNLALQYPANADGTSQFEQGSSIDIQWEDSSLTDSCMNFYLVQAEADGRTAFRSQIVKRCLTPVQKGSFPWIIPDKFSGGGFRIYGAFGDSAAFGNSFSIVSRKNRTPTR